MIAKNISFFIASGLLSAFSFGAAQVTITIDTGTRSLQNQNEVALTAGALGVDGDGAVFQVGYYVGATVNNNFGGGEFIPLTGATSVFGISTTIGDSVDNGAGNGEVFSLPLEILAGGPNDSLFPSVGTPLSARFFNATTIALSTHFQSVSNNLWVWATPANIPSNPSIEINFDAAGLVAKDGTNVATPGSNIRTSVAIVPEPATMSLMLVGLVSLASRRRRQVA
jgi:hypothetical protein